ncbi:MAG: PQQ-like beta-propeller repeat protein [Verrucomicrobiales bacterium]|nr:PQQ-like beta-propeller repeat protein [Verrucomicrobiales bacterium]
MSTAGQTKQASARLPEEWLKGAPVAGAAAAVLAVILWLLLTGAPALPMRVPGTDRAPGAEAPPTGNPVLAGKVVAGPGQPADLPGLWPGFRGRQLDGIAHDSPPLARSWPGGRPPELWSVSLGEGYAGPAVKDGRVYILDYDQEAKRDALRCLSLGDGREIWRFTYPVSVKRNHGMSRTVPAVADGIVVALGPKCHVAAVDAVTGELRWGLDLVQEFGARVPQWYAGQCPLIENGRVILAPGGPEALVMAVNLQSGEVLWQSPNPDDWKMTHASILPIEFGGQRQYVYCASHGVVGVAADTGQRLWSTTDWKISIATVPSPVDVGGGRIFFSGGYNAGSLMLQLEAKDGAVAPLTEFRLPARTFGATQQTPVFRDGHLYGVRPDGALVCLDRQGAVVWDSGSEVNHGIGPFLLADGLLLLMDDDGRLRLAEATPLGYRPVAGAQVLDGRESWGPLALAGSRLLARDLTRLVCLEIGAIDHEHP